MLLDNQTTAEFVATDHHQNGANEHGHKGWCQQQCIVGFVLTDSLPITDCELMLFINVRGGRLKWWSLAVGSCWLAIAGPVVLPRNNMILHFRHKVRWKIPRCTKHSKRTVSVLLYKLEKTALDRGQTNCSSHESITLTFNPLRVTVMTYSQAKVQGQQSAGSEDRVETNRWTDGRRWLHDLPC